MPTKIVNRQLVFEDDSNDDMPSNKKERKSPITIDMNLSEIVVRTSEIYKKKYELYFVTRKKVNIDITGDNSLSPIQEFQLYQLLHAIDKEENVIDIKYENVHYIISGNQTTMIPFSRLNTYIVTAKMHSIINDATLSIKKTNEKANSKTSIKIMDIYIKEVPEKIKKTSSLQNISSISCPIQLKGNTKKVLSTSDASESPSFFFRVIVSICSFVNSCSFGTSGGLDFFLALPNVNLS